MTTTAEQMRAWRGPAVLSFGFRPFFLMAGIWAAIAMAIWIAMLAGILELPTRFDPVSWHAHELLFGYLAAVIAGFLLTAVPNWTGRLPIVGWPLGLLAVLWLAGRIAVASSIWMPAMIVAMIDCAFLAALMLAIGREILTGGNWRNLPVLGLLGLFLAGNALFHYAGVSQSAASQTGMRLGVAVAVMLISLIGGRIVPSFTRNWLVKHGHSARPDPFDVLDRITVLIFTIALLVWVVAPESLAAGSILLLAGMMQGWRLFRWAGLQTLEEPLVWVLHAGYAFLPLGAVVLALAILWEDILLVQAAQHLWMAGAIGLMTLAVMSRATLGHTGRKLTAGPGTTTVYLSLIGSVFLRFSAGAWPQLAAELYQLSGLLWIAAFFGFAAIYGPMLMRPRAGS
jgi:uncharacterized protein involved in response to NO